MNKISISALAVALMFLNACGLTLGIRGNGRVVSDQKNVEDFSEVQAGGAFDIDWRNGPPSLRITTDENLLEYIDTDVSNNRLRLRTRERLRPTHGIKVIVTSATRKGAKLSGAVDLIASQLSGPKFYFKSTGASDVRLDGNVDELFADMTGASDLNAKNLHTRKVEISTTGAADAEISVSEVLRVSITGAGSVYYYGNPPTIEKHVTGAGTIKRRD